MERDLNEGAVLKTVLTRGVDTTPGDLENEVVHTIKDLPTLVKQGEHYIALEFIVTQRVYLKMHQSMSKPAKKRALKELQSMGWDAFREFGREVSKRQWRNELSLCYVSNSY